MTKNKRKGELIMSFTKNKLSKFLLIFMMLFALVLPSTISADNGEFRETGTLTVNKLRQEAGQQNPGGTGLPDQAPVGAPVEGVTFSLTLVESFDPVTNTWTAVTGQTAITGVTESDGTYVFQGLALGRYEVREIDGPADIKLNPGVFSVDIPMTVPEGDELIYDVHIYPKNEIIRKSVSLKKIGEDENPIAGATFNIYDKDGEIALDSEGNPIGLLTTGGDGMIHVDGLAQGEYYFQEMSVPNTVLINNTEIWFSIVKGNLVDGVFEASPTGQYIKIIWENVEGFAFDGTVINYNPPTVDKDVVEEGSIDREQEFTYTIKIHTPTDLRDYKELYVTDILDDRLTFVSNEAVAGVTFTRVGQNLRWEFDPATAPVDTDVTLTFKAKINKDAVFDVDGITNRAILNFDNNRGGDGTPKDDVVVYPSDGGFIVTKVDKSIPAVRLAGAKFKLTNLAGDVIDTTGLGDVVKVNGVVFNGLLEDLTTRADGTFEITGLTPGSYLLHETQAPTYLDSEGLTKAYRLLAKPVEIQVMDTIYNLDITVVNAKSGWVLPATGGLGTVVFTIVGTSLMVSALYGFTRRKKEIH